MDISFRPDRIGKAIKRSEFISNKIKNMSIVCAMLVPFIHVGKPSIVGSSGWYVYQFTAEGICRIAVPFFCACSGYFLSKHFADKGWYVSQVGKRVKTLMVPYLLWSIFFYLFIYALFLISPSNPVCWRMRVNVSVISRMLMAFGLSLEKVPMLYPLWYLRFLFLLVLVSPVFAVGKRFWKFVIFAGMAFFYLAFNPGDGSPIGIHLGFPFEAALYFYCGIVLRGSRLKVYVGKICEISPVLLWSGVWLLVVLRTVLSRYGYIGGLFCFIKPLFVFWGIITVWSDIPSKVWPNKFVSLSFLLYVTHVFGLQLFSFVFGRDSDNALMLLGRVAFGLCFALLVSHLLKNVVGNKVSFLWGYRQ